MNEEIKPDPELLYSANPEHATEVEATTRMGRLNEQFTAIADKVSSGLGQWWFSILSLIILGLWTVYGAFVISHQVSDWFTSQQWNFPLNTITTVGEWFIGALVAAAANRVERNNHKLQAQQAETQAHQQAHQTEVLEKLDSIVGQEDKEIAGAENNLLAQGKQIVAIAEHLDKQDEMILTTQQQVLEIVQRLDAQQKGEQSIP